MDWWLTQGVPHLLNNVSWDRIQNPHDPERDEATENGWIDDVVDV